MISTVPNQKLKALKFLGPILDARRKQIQNEKSSEGMENLPVGVSLLTF